MQALHNRRSFLRNIAHTGAAVALAPTLVSSARAASHPDLEQHKLAAIEFRQIDLTWPRLVGKNSRLDVHGFGPKPTIVILKTDQGATGWGSIIGNVKSVEEIRSQVVGKAVAELFDPASGIRAKHLRPLDIPLHDLAGVILRQPVWRMLGAQKAEPLLIYSGMVYFDDLDPADKPAGIQKVLENARWDYDYGYRHLKVKIGRGGKWMPGQQGLERDMQVIRELHKTLPDATLLVDGNEMFTVDSMIAFLNGVQGIDLFWVEEPFHETLNDWRKLRSWMEANGRARTWRADGEAGNDYPVLEELYKDHTVNVCLYDILSHGFTPWRSLMPELKQKKITSSPHAWGSGLNTIYIGHLGAGLGNVLTVEGVTCSQKDVDFGGNRIRNGKLELSSEPGFGLKLRTT